MFTYLLTHYTNHALGNISLAAMSAGLEYHVWLWQSTLGTLLLYTALAVHASLGLWALYERRHFRFKTSEAIQLIFGLSIPLLLAAHVVAERVGLELYGIERGYAQALHAFWVASPTRGVLQSVALIVAWIHGCIGVLLLAAAQTLVPARGAVAARRGGAASDARAARLTTRAGARSCALSTLPEWQAENLTPGQIGTPEQNAGLVDIREKILYAWAGAIVLVLLARGVRAIAERRRGLVRISYPDGRTRARSARPERPRSELALQRPARVRVRRARTLLDVPGPHRRRLERIARAVAARDRRAGARRLRRRRRGAPCLPVAAEDRRHRRSAAPAQCRRIVCGREPAAAQRARSATSSACSSTCAARRKWRRGGCRSTRCSSSIDSSARCRRR